MAILELQPSARSSLTSSSFLLDPCSVVRELMDNSIDASARNIVIEVDSGSGGCKQITVKDDGFGVKMQDREFLCLEHYTSKIREYSEIENNCSLGFRGDALFQMANLAARKGTMEVTTKTKDDPVGERWLVQNTGQIKDSIKKKITCGNGTTITIRNLFGGLKVRFIEYSTKARQIIAKIQNLINHYSITNRKIRFQFYLTTLNRDYSIHKKQLQQVIDQNMSIPRVLMKLANVKMSTGYDFVHKLDEEVNYFTKIELILPINQNVSEFFTGRGLNRFVTVNKRSLSTSLGFGRDVLNLINSVCKRSFTLLPTCWYVNLKIDPKFVDVNIEPQKNDILIAHHEIFLQSLEKYFSSVIVKEVGVRANEENLNFAKTPNSEITRNDTDHLVQDPQLIIDTATGTASNIDNSQTSHLEQQDFEVAPIEQCNSDKDIIEKIGVSAEIPEIHVVNSKQLGQNFPISGNAPAPKKILCNNLAQSKLGKIGTSLKQSSLIRKTSQLTSWHESEQKSLKLITDNIETLIVNHHFKPCYSDYKSSNQEINWLMRNDGRDSILEFITNSCPKNSTYKKCSMTRTDNGWLLFPEYT